ncbi:dual specificity protein phosphatase 3-like [Argopecten irradians]|uniref:dual specificity protein phosphatase 3-like n=1 Tax=Argopecten irradians TaxID=31199 RepID=UPI003722A09F
MFLFPISTKSKGMADYNQETFDTVKGYLQERRDADAPKPIQPNAFRMPLGPKTNFNEVYPGIILGNHVCAKDPEKLKKIGVTHVLNCAQGSKINQINTDEEFFSEAGISFYGIKAMDISTCDISPHFVPAADFINAALIADGNKVYVHCMEGISRSSTMVIAFLMLKRSMTLMEAVTAVRAKREIFPNTGFLKQLCTLNKSLYEAQ